jgi:hypothetical protein
MNQSYHEASGTRKAGQCLGSRPKRGPDTAPLLRQKPPEWVKLQEESRPSGKQGKDFEPVA